MIGSSRNYAIGMAHFQIAGGIKSLLMVCAVYLLLFFSGLALFFYSDSVSPVHTGLTGIIVILLLIIEAIVLIVVGSFRVSAAIRNDMTSHMIESHRLMPIPAWRAVLGYILGGATHVIVFALLHVALAYIFAGVTSTSFFDVSRNQIVLFLFAGLIWTLSALGTLLFRHMYFIVIGALVVSGCLLIPAYALLPGFALLVGPLIGNGIFSFPAPADVGQWTYLLSFAGQLAFIAIFFAGACRRYRGTYATTFTQLQAVLLLLAWCVISAIGMVTWDNFHFAGELFSNRPTSVFWGQTVASLAAALLLAIIPVVTFSKDRVRTKTRAPLAFLYLLACAVGIAIIAAAGTGMMNRNLAGPTIIAGLVALAHILTVFLLLKLLQNIRPLLATLIIGGSLLVYWVVPLILELIRAMMDHGPDERFFSILSTLSPLGLLITIWGPAAEHMPSPITGLVFQWVIVLILAAYALGAHRRRAARSTETLSAPFVIPPPPPPPPAPPVTSAPPAASSSSPASPPA